LELNTMSIWGALAERFETEKPQRKLLALDGGGIRGVITLEILAELERQLAEKTGQGKAFRLGQYFDYVAGTSTGAIVAAGLAVGAANSKTRTADRERWAREDAAVRAWFDEGSWPHQRSERANHRDVDR
jgi:predicted acylesterase/phospholipase RssA